MPVLIVALTSLLGFAAILVLLWVADRLESKALQRKNMVCAARPLPLLSVAQAFDPKYAVLWQEPLLALDMIESGGPSGIPVSRLQPLFRRAATRLPEVYEGYTFAEWVRFLEEAHLIAWNGYELALTADGRDFLRYRFTTSALIETQGDALAR
jgi:hypothetical protein